MGSSLVYPRQSLDTTNPRTTSSYPILMGHGAPPQGKGGLDHGESRKDSSTSADKLCGRKPRARLLPGETFDGGKKEDARWQR